MGGAWEDMGTPVSLVLNWEHHLLFLFLFGFLLVNVFYHQHILVSNLLTDLTVQERGELGGKTAVEAATAADSGLSTCS